MFNPAVTIVNQKSPWAKLGKNSKITGTAESAIVKAGFNAPAYCNGIRWNFDAINPAVAIVVCVAEAIQIGGNCLTFTMVNPAAPGRKLDVSHLWTPNRAPLDHQKVKSPSHLKVVLLLVFASDAC